ncbi:N-terminal EF-hand calcium-binding protein 1 [Leopardus geoffroyi]|uniref:N-terminal EF-hand calcium-binding protein 1 n=1 Tax=Herpailurus yagouaroundi TaxID=1608482 RepID=UPI001AD70D05|nr:N-terminal EF-hand calcium-binding protein 1 [Puma yagouaroundi]XP_040349875.1 N-terminal EF-hand calcium-binding protein 1 [Puma yagouaroundi]XP_043457276.1 N-terminal EF-hand calcium-binding protein 1 [Prionailurus bengalensis]XP_043457277.1 N-terminal EF-hand calcium-binding protein 1 [Prionailurus bengalensis]XP_045310237.1 N-terminal EF-hand calcium-binding protein 1 [Leopardus geoffroyi]XP_045310238.1 N-terminal EF-hand calcium-binding protein 1 [Leopardus geoffroyi]
MRRIRRRQPREGGGASESAWERGGQSREGERAERDAGEARGSERPLGSRSPAAVRPRPCPSPCGRPAPLRPPPSGLPRMEDSRETSPSSNNSSEELSSALQLSKGMSIFLDILRRADKNDDGKLSFEEFKAYFADGVLSGEELHELFHTIDTHNTNNLDTEELCEYFSQHLGEYENVLAALEDLNLSILKAMGKTKKDYQEASNLEQFVTRFLLKETLNQLQSLQNSLECAMETTEEQTRQERQGPTKPEVLLIQWPGKRSSRRVQRHNSFSPKSPQFSACGPGLLEEDNQWMTQINRLQKLIDRLEKKDLKLEPREEEVIEGNTKSHIMLVQRQMSVIEEDLEEFQLALKHYVESASSQSGCLRISIQKLSNESRYMIYEFWENSSVWNSHLQTNYSKTFQRSNVDFLETPELTSTMLVPASWWILNN